MNRTATRERFLVLYPEQGGLSNPKRCWNWFDTANGRAAREAASIPSAVDQVGRAHPADRLRVAIAGMSAGASMAALLVTLHPGRFVALVMHCGIPTGTAASTGSALAAMRGHRDTMPLKVSHAVMASDRPPLLLFCRAMPPLQWSRSISPTRSNSPRSTRPVASACSIPPSAS